MMSNSAATTSQSPLISIPQKTTTEVDLASPVRSLISASYGEDPKKWTEQTNGLNRARQDAVRGAGSGDGKGKGDAVGRDLLFKWFHILEMLELRFPELRVPFPWKDAFTHKSISQHSLAYEKASIIFNIACVLTSLASSQLRSSSSEGLKRAYTSLRQAGGLFSYINDNFLHAPSTDMSREVIKCLINIAMAQASEVFLEKCIEEKKGAGLISKIASHTSGIYTVLSEDLKEWVGKGVLERSWLLCVQAKAKYITSVTQYYKALADDAAGSHGACLVRVTLAESLAKEALRLAHQFHSFVNGSLASSQSLPSDAGPALTAVITHHLALCTERKDAAVKDNDLIYHDILPSESTLPAVEKAVAATPISVQDIYAAPEVQKVTGPDIFSKLVPLGVHESASMYSEEKAKLARAETERHDLSCGELQASLEYMGLPSSLNKYRNLGKGSNAAVEALADPGREVMEWSEEEARGGGSRGADGLGSGTEGVESALDRIEKLKRTASDTLESLTSILDNDNRECEKARVRFGHRFTQEPAGAQVRGMRSDIKSNREALQAADQNDQHIKALWAEIRPQVELLIGGRDRLERVFAETIAGGNSNSSNKESLIDLGETDDLADEASTRKVEEKVEQIDGILTKLNKIKKERGEVLMDLKEKIQSDDISQILILNRRAQNVEPAIFKQELEKFKPHQSRISLSINAQQSLIHELTKHWKELNELKASQKARKRWEEMEVKRKELIKRLRIAKEKHAEVRAATNKGIQFYTDLGEIASALSYSVKNFTEERRVEREKLIGEVEWEEKLNQPSNSSAPPRAPSSPPNSIDQSRYASPPPPPSLSSAMGSMNLGERGSMSPAPAPAPSSHPQPTSAGSYQSSLYSQPPPNHSSISNPNRAPSFPPPPPQSNFQQPQSSPYDSMAMFESSPFGSKGEQSLHPPTNGYGSQSSQYQYQAPTNQQSYARPPPPVPSQPGHQQYSQGSGSSALPPPPPQFQIQFSPSPSPHTAPPPASSIYQAQYQQPAQPPQPQFGRPPQPQQYGTYPSTNYQNQPPPPPPPSWR